MTQRERLGQIQKVIYLPQIRTKFVKSQMVWILIHAPKTSFKSFEYELRIFNTQFYFPDAPL